MSKIPLIVSLVVSLTVAQQACKDNILESVCTEVVQSNQCAQFMNFCMKTCGYCENEATKTTLEPWGPWSLFSECSKTCGVGIQKRKRWCLIAGLCVGQGFQLRRCKVTSCRATTTPLAPLFPTNIYQRPVVPMWQSWSAYKPCSKSCGTGIRSRHRLCYVVGLCYGRTTEYQYCNTNPCRSPGVSVSVGISSGDDNFLLKILSGQLSTVIQLDPTSTTRSTTTATSASFQRRHLSAQTTGRPATTPKQATSTSPTMSHITKAMQPSTTITTTRPTTATSTTMTTRPTTASSTTTTTRPTTTSSTTTRPTTSSTTSSTTTTTTTRPTTASSTTTTTRPTTASSTTTTTRPTTTSSTTTRPTTSSTTSSTTTTTTTRPTTASSTTTTTRPTTASSTTTTTRPTTTSSTTTTTRPPTTSSTTTTTTTRPTTTPSTTTKTTTTRQPTTTTTKPTTPSALWSNWGDFMPCSVTCGIGRSSRQRECLRGDCMGEIKEEKTCRLDPCPAAPTWSLCSKSCGMGTTYKFTSASCQDANNRTCIRTYKHCNTQPCPRAKCGNTQTRRKGIPHSCCDETEKVQQTSSRRVFNGFFSKPADWPWMVYLEINRQQLCGGSIINNNWLVTAAHCVYSVNEILVHPSKIIGYVGMVKRSEVGRTNMVSFSRAVPHPQYDFIKNDIALLRFSEPVRFSNTIRPIMLPDGEVTPTDTTCYSMGWGITDSQKVTPSDALMDVPLINLPYDVCVNSYQSTQEIPFIMGTNKLLCVGNLLGHADSCMGDSGGPLVCQRCNSCDWYIAGIISFGPKNCNTMGVPGMYTKVIEYENWIKLHVQMFTPNIRQFCPYKIGP